VSVEVQPMEVGRRGENYRAVIRLVGLVDIDTHQIVSVSK
jgi:hypothetical protein